MEQHNTDNQPPKPRKPRRKRPNGRWTNPASPLQAARFAHKLSGRAVVVGIRAICEGHAGQPCHIDVSKLSDYETGNRRMSVDHITAFAKFYQKSPEELGLIHWRDTPQTANSAAALTGQGETDEQQLVAAWLLRSAAAVVGTLVKAFADYPLRPAAVPAAAASARDSHPVATDAADAADEDTLGDDDETPGVTRPDGNPSDEEPPDEEPPPEPAGVR